MSSIAPTITAGSYHEFQRQLVRVKPFAERIHIDLMDGMFAPTTSISLDEIEVPHDIVTDIHVMYVNPTRYIEKFIGLKPNLVIVHAEAKGDFAELADALHDAGIKVGLALLPETEVKNIAPAIALVDHVLIFSGNLGYQGGSRADPNLVYKINQIRRLKRYIEIGWDGGVNQQNATALVKAGIDVLNVGGYIQHADDPERMYQKLVKACA